MSNLQDIQIDKIETDIMSILYANMDCGFSQYALFNKLLTDKYDGQYTNSISPNFKSKFLLVLKNLMSKYDDVKVIRTDEGMYQVWVSSGSESELIDKNEKNLIQTQTQTQTQISKPNSWWKTTVTINSIPFDKTDNAKMYDYVYENNLTEHLNWSDPWYGNSIYHELVLVENLNQIQRLIEQEQFNFFVKNSKGLSPIDLALQSNSSELKKLFTEALVKKITSLKEKTDMEREQTNKQIFELAMRKSFLESDEYKNKIISDVMITTFLKMKFLNYYESNKIYVISALIFFIAVKLFF